MRRFRSVLQIKESEAKLLRARMDDNGCCASEFRSYMWASYFSNCERPKSSSNLQGNRLILYLQSILGLGSTGFAMNVPRTISLQTTNVCKETIKCTSAILQPSFRIVTRVFRNSPFGGRMSVSQIVCTA